MQGFGNVGSNAAQLMHQAGYKVIGIGEWDGGLYNTNGIDINALVKYKAHNGTIHGFPGAEKATTAELLITDCDVLIPAATENVITTKNAAQVKAKIIIEGANGPTTSGADEILNDKKVFVMPDILANAGGVTVSYFEWVQDRQGYFWKESVVNEQLEHIMVSAFEDVVNMAEQHKVSPTVSALICWRLTGWHTLSGSVEFTPERFTPSRETDRVLQRDGRSTRNEPSLRHFRGKIPANAVTLPHCKTQAGLP